MGRLNCRWRWLATLRVIESLIRSIKLVRRIVLPFVTKLDKSFPRQSTNRVRKSERKRGRAAKCIAKIETNVRKRFNRNELHKHVPKTIDKKKRDSSGLKKRMHFIEHESHQ